MSAKIGIGRFISLNEIEGPHVADMQKSPLLYKWFYGKGQLNSVINFQQSMYNRLLSLLKSAGLSKIAVN